jgi:hypothetical protein
MVKLFYFLKWQCHDIGIGEKNNICFHKFMVRNDDHIIINMDDEFLR